MIVDFGSALRSNNSTDDVGDPDFCAPEIFHHDKRGYDSRVDLFSLGLVYFRIFTGKYLCDCLIKKDCCFFLWRMQNYFKNLKQEKIDKKIFENMSKYSYLFTSDTSFSVLKYIHGEVDGEEFSEHEVYRNCYLTRSEKDVLIGFDYLYIMHGLLQVISRFSMVFRFSFLHQIFTDSRLKSAYMRFV